jgi:signal transduction histidine kinase
MELAMMRRTSRSAGELAEPIHDPKLRRRAEAAVLRETGRPLPEPSDLQEARRELELTRHAVDLLSADLARTRRELKRAKDRCRDLYDQAPIAYLSLDPSGIILEANRTAAALLATSVPHLLRSRVSEFVAARDLGELRRHLDRTFSAEGRDSCTLTLRRADAEERPVRLESIHVAASNRLRAQCRTNVVDPAELLASPAEADEQLSRGQRMELLGEIACGLAHEFNNVLQVVCGCVELAIERAGGDAAIRSWLEKCRAAAIQGQNLARQVLACRGQPAQPPRPIAVDDVVRSEADLVSHSIGRRIRIEVSARAGGLSVQAREGQLQQVLLNLLINARDAMPDGGAIRIETEHVELGEPEAGALGLAAGGYVRISVADEGCGMTEETCRRIFEPSFTTKARGRGTGLGLAIVRDLVSQVRGQVEVESRPGAGTTFRLLLPALAAPTG